MMVKFNMILAMDVNGGIGKNNTLPWPHHKEDMKQFRDKTIGDGNNCIIMGSTTFKSIGNKPLMNRMNYVLTRNNNSGQCYPGLKFVSSIENLIHVLKDETFDNHWIIGGANIYTTFFNDYSEYLSEIHVTLFHDSYDCDTFIDKKTFDSDNSVYKLSSENIINDVTYQVFKSIKK